MRKTLLIGLLVVPLLINAQKESGLLGAWTIDLRPSPDAEGYYQVFEISSINGVRFESSFYGSTLDGGLLNTQWERLYFDFSTSDQSHTYYHSGYLLNGKLHGISYCRGKEFTASWTGVKK